MASPGRGAPSPRIVGLDAAAALERIGRRARADDGPDAAAVAARAGDVLRRLHDRHSAAHPDLCVALARLFLRGDPGARRSRGDDPWPDIVRALLGGLLSAGGDGGEERTAHRRSGVESRRVALRKSLKDARLQAVFLEMAVDPMIDRAWDEAGAPRPMTVAPALGGDARRAQAALAAFQTAFGRLASDPEKMGAEFWRRAEAALRAPRRAAGRRLLPFEADAATLHLLDARTGAGAGARRRAPTLRRAAPVSPVERIDALPPDGAPAGVRTVVGEQYVQDALLSEFIWPRPLLADRVLADGYLVRRRPPKRQQRRRLLLIGLCHVWPMNDAARIAKVGWIDAAMRLGARLRGLGYERCDLAWAETAPGGAMALGCDVDRARWPRSLGALTRPTPARLRRLLMEAANWRPAAADTRPNFLEPLLCLEPPLSRAAPVLAAAAFGALAADGGERLDFRDYAAVALTAIAPPAPDGLPETADVETLVHGPLRLSGRRGSTSVGLMRCADAPESAVFETRAEDRADAFIRFAPAVAPVSSAAAGVDVELAFGDISIAVEDAALELLNAGG